MNNDFEEKGYISVDLNLGFEDLMVKIFEECVRRNKILPEQNPVVSCESVDISMEY